MRIANVSAIRAIERATSGIEGTGSLSPRARRVLQVYLVLIKMGYEAVAAPLGAIADAMKRSSNGESGSIRTLQRANDELIEAGYIDIAEDKFTKYRKGVIIFFQLPAFAYWTQRRSGTVVPMPQSGSAHNVNQCRQVTTSCRDTEVSSPKMSDNSSPTTEVSSSETESHTVNPCVHITTGCRDYEVTSNINSPKIPNSTNKKKEPRAGAHAIKNNSKRRLKNAVLFSLGCVLTALGDLTKYEKRKVRARADCEVKAVIGEIELLNPSGVDWTYWERRWGEMTIAQREITIRREILPLLLGRPSPTPTSTPGTYVPNPNTVVVTERTDTPMDGPMRDQIREMREKLEAICTAKVVLPAAAAPPPASSVPTNTAASSETESCLDDAEMRMLIEARARARLVNSR